MGAKIEKEGVKVELTGGAELRMGNWIMRIEDDKIVAINGKDEYTFRPQSNGWIKFKNNYYTGVLYSCGIDGESVGRDRKFDLCFCEVAKSG